MLLSINMSIRILWLQHQHHLTFESWRNCSKLVLHFTDMWTVKHSLLQSPSPVTRGGKTLPREREKCFSFDKCWAFTVSTLTSTTFPFWWHESVGKLWAAASDDSKTCFFLMSDSFTLSQWKELPFPWLLSEIVQFCLALRYSRWTDFQLVVGRWFVLRSFAKMNNFVNVQS